MAAFNSEEEGTAYPHTSLPSRLSSFPLGSGGVSGLLHRKRKMLGDLGFKPHLER